VEAPSVDAGGTLHETYRILFHIQGKMLGEASFDPGGWPSLGYRRTGLAYFCPFCGEVWGRVVLVDSKGVRNPMEITQVSCPSHPDSYSLPGSILAGRLENLLPLLPPAVLRREFDLHLRKETQ